MLVCEYNVLRDILIDLFVTCLVNPEISHLNMVMKRLSICHLVDIIAFITIPCKLNIFHFWSKKPLNSKYFLCFDNLSVSSGCHNHIPSTGWHK